MKIVKKLIITSVISVLILTVGVSTASAYPLVEASMSPTNESRIASSGYFSKNLSWDGGLSNTYNVEYYDGNKTLFYDPSANYYSKRVSSYYNKGNLSIKTWYTQLRVSNGDTAYAYGTVTLKDR
ncbi:hypothetical protein EDD68_1422 [Melghiribacillus thermohalophilus]|uniref:Uncharacterized protein n=1 Tax=Melghiribacillus thermohalophilus TaxID=1324956 RepID=A0A4R3MLG6_9BACI|nr:hypothetical protein [Melghiribacillus thermohalophilus]TCT14392.1 hypothetical protein EDD68_1422 [Melghiribacillus thermohalophilus]